MSAINVECDKVGGEESSELCVFFQFGSCCCCCVNSSTVFTGYVLLVLYFFLFSSFLKNKFSIFLNRENLLIVRRHPGDSRDAVDKLGPIEDVCILEHAVFQRDNDKLTLFEMTLQHRSNILRVGQVKRGINLVQNVNWRRLQQ